jgi:hypothetical protein
MEAYQICITGSENIIEALKSVQQKGISINLVTPEMKSIRTEYISSIISNFETYGECKLWTDSFIDNLSSMDVDIIRVKINAQYKKSDEDKSLYLEVCFPPRNEDLPMLYNSDLALMFAVDRVYDKSIYDYFTKKYADYDMEMCLYDSFVENDYDWFSYYEDEEIIQ